MVDIAPALLEKIRQSFLDNIQKNERAALIMRQIEAGIATYEKAGDYAYEIGTALADAFAEHITPDALPDGKMYQNIAEKVIAPMLEENHKLVSDTAVHVQQLLNKNAGIGLKAQASPLNKGRVSGIVHKVSNAPEFASVAWALNEPVKTFSQSVVDETLQKNVKFQGEFGLKPKVTRKTVGGCCEWCSNLAGSYRYPDVPHDVYRRHDRCRCVVDYDPGSGKKQSVHSGTEGTRNYIQDEYGDYVQTKEARLRHAKEMAETEKERMAAAREKRIATWGKKSNKTQK